MSGEQYNLTEQEFITGNGYPITDVEFTDFNNDQQPSSRWNTVRHVAGRVAAAGMLTAGALYTTTSSEEVVAAAYASEASPTCYGDYCSGQYADQVGCDTDARTLTTVEITKSGVVYGVDISTTPGVTVGNNGPSETLAILEVRRSDTCGTTWARLNARSDSNINALGIQQNGGYTQTRNVGQFLEGSPAALSFTPMIYGLNNSYQGYVMRNGSALRAGVDTRESTYWTTE